MASFLEEFLLEGRVLSRHRQKHIQRNNFEFGTELVQDPLDALDVARLPDVQKEELGTLPVEPRKFLKISNRLGLRPRRRKVVIVGHERLAIPDRECE